MDEGCDGKSIIDTNDLLQPQKLTLLNPLRINHPIPHKELHLHLPRQPHRPQCKLILQTLPRLNLISQLLAIKTEEDRVRGDDINVSDLIDLTGISQVEGQVGVLGVDEHVLDPFGDVELEVGGGWLDLIVKHVFFAFELQVGVFFCGEVVGVLGGEVVVALDDAEELPFDALDDELAFFIRDYFQGHLLNLACFEMNLLDNRLKIKSLFLFFIDMP